MACRLETSNPGCGYIIVEGRRSIGGTWDLFRYPGIRSDSDMYSYAYAFRPWSSEQRIASGETIRTYLRQTVDEYGLERRIRFGHRVEMVEWSSADRRWVATGTKAQTSDDDGERVPFQVSCKFLVTCTGYYDYSQGYRPDINGQDTFRGEIIDPQFWPAGFDYTGRRVLVIGSGATAVTLVPAMAAAAEHVTMLQRTPTYVFARPMTDAPTAFLKRWIGRNWATYLARVRHVLVQWLSVHAARAFPRALGRLLRRHMAARLRSGSGPDIDVNLHFNPPYAPWEQRLCMSPDGDLFEALKSGRASIITGRIDRFTPTGVRLVSGESIDADIVVMATGLKLQFLGGIELRIDAKPVVPTELISYRGMMFRNVPNWVTMSGYTAASWTLRVDLVSEYVSRLLRLMADRNAEVAVPTSDAPPAPTESIVTNLRAAGYVQRAIAHLPRQGRRAPWRNSDDYLRDYFDIKHGPIEDGVLDLRVDVDTTPRKTLNRV